MTRSARRSLLVHTVERAIALSVAALLAATPIVAQQAPAANDSYIATSAGAGRFPLASSGRSAPIYVSAGDYAGVIRAASDLRADIGRVAGTEPIVASGSPAAQLVVLVGTLGRSPVIDELVRRRKVDVSGIAGRWETFLLQVVEAPLPGVDRALVIAGSDKRGTIYGIYDLSAQIGVSPWYWWADVPVRRQRELFVLPGRHTRGEPAVRYRGIFINDEAPALSGWVRETFGGFNHQFYEKVFELVLRLKGNYLWPAMWGNAFADDDTLSPRLADEYGIVMGTSHHEPMTRAQAEWRKYGSGPWNYEQNDSTLRAFWREGIRRMGARENIVTLGMRGDGDMPMTEGSNVALLERIVADQRKMLAEVTHQDPSATPQLWALYKEVQDYHDRGMRVPDDVTLLFSDDNWGNIRRLPSGADARRSGGFGIYYHFDYVGGPRNYKWINTNPIARVWEQMHLAYRSGANRIWIVNVGDIKPMELPTQFFLELAWNPAAFPAERLVAFTRRWAAQQFGTEHAAAIADIVTAYTTYNGRRKPELLAPETYSLTNYREADTVVADYRRLAEEATRVGAMLSPEYRNAYFQLVLHPVLASANLNDLYVTVAKNRLFALQGRASTNALADRARALFERDAELSRQYHETAGGKWNHMMDQTHIGYTYWQEPPRDAMPRVDVIRVPRAAEMGIAIEGQDRPGPIGPPGGAPRLPVLPEFDAYQRQTFFIDVFNHGQTRFSFTATPSEPWLVVTPSGSAVDTAQRVLVSVDWLRVPSGKHRVSITLAPNDSATVAGVRRFVVEAAVNNPATPKRDQVIGFVEGNGYVSMEAEHYSRAVATAPLAWQRIPNFGRTLSGMTTMPVTAASQHPGGESPRLEYRVFLLDSGTVTVRAYLSPTLNYTGRREGLRYAISFDDAPPQIVNTTADSSNTAWEKSVGDAIRTLETRHAIGAGQHTLRFWMVDPGVVLQKLVIDAGGVKPSYLGPPESFRREPPPAATRVPDGRLRARAPATSDPRFDWFAYEGTDSVYRTVSAGPNDYVNPILAGFYPDPSMVRAGDDYYLVTSSFAYFPGVPIFHSRDLVQWTQIGHVLDRPSQLRLDSAGISRGIFAPVIRHHAGTFYMITTLVDRGGNFFVTATNPAGPWSDPVWLPEVDGIDPSFFFDDDGRVYVLNNGPPVGPPLYEGHRAIWIQEFDPVARGMIGPRSVIVNGGVDLAKHPIWIEAPHIFRRNGLYYLICAEGGTADQHSEVVFRGNSPRGPWEPYAGNPILTQRHLNPSRPFPVTSTGHADFVETPNGEWWAVFLGTRPYGDDLYNTGRETFLMPVRWVDGWPVMATGTETVPYVHSRPNLPKQPAAPIPLSGNFSYREEFTSSALAPYWHFVRTPREAWHDLTSSPGWLTIRARSADLSRRGQASFIGRRQQHASASASVAMRYVPEREGDKAGIVAFQNDDFYYFLSVARVNGQSVVQLEQHAGATKPATVLASAPMTPIDTGTVFLRIRARGSRYDFFYGVTPDAWTPLHRDADGTILSTRVAGGFVGAMFGMYAYRGSP